MKNKPITCKEDLIGEKRKCPYPGCNIEFIISNDKHSHWNGKHMYSTDLDTQWEYYKYGQEQQKKLYYGK